MNSHTSLQRQAGQTCPFTDEETKAPQPRPMPRSYSWEVMELRLKISGGVTSAHDLMSVLSVKPSPNDSRKRQEKCASRVQTPWDTTEAGIAQGCHTTPEHQAVCLDLFSPQVIQMKGNYLKADTKLPQRKCPQYSFR